MKSLSLFFILFVFNINAQVSPLLNTTWNQTCYYNEQMPSVGSGGSCGNAYTGCNATAMAQICKYYAYPSTGFGNHCNSNSPSDCVDFSSSNYNYLVMPNNVTSSNSDVAILMYDLGVAVDMSWSGTNSTSFFSSTTLKKYFAYSPKMYSTATFLFPTTAALIEAIKLELDSGRPVYAKGGGHFYLIDGYDLTDKFHMNFGWGGTYDGYYTINSVVNPGGTFTPSNFIFNIMPLQGELETNKDTISLGAVGVFFEDLEFTSTLDWTINSANSWITPSLINGTKGYFNHIIGSHFSTSTNNGAQRIGYISIKNDLKTDTIVVIQAASPMKFSPDTLNFTFNGGIQTINVELDSWANWNIINTESWINLSSSNGTGNEAINVTASLNNSGVPRSAYLNLTSGLFKDSVYITQDVEFTTGLEKHQSNKFNIYPNPVSLVLYIDGIGDLENSFIIDVIGNRYELNIQNNHGMRQVNVSNLQKGIYFLIINGKIMKFIKN